MDRAANLAAAHKQIAELLSTVETLTQERDDAVSRLAAAESLANENRQLKENESLQRQNEKLRAKARDLEEQVDQLAARLANDRRGNA